MKSFKRILFVLGVLASVSGVFVQSAGSRPAQPRVAISAFKELRNNPRLLYTLPCEALRDKYLVLRDRTMGPEYAPKIKGRLKRYPIAVVNALRTPFHIIGEKAVNFGKSVVTKFTKNKSSNSQAAQSVKPLSEAQREIELIEKYLNPNPSGLNNLKPAEEIKHAKQVRDRAVSAALDPVSVDSKNIKASASLVKQEQVKWEKGVVSDEDLPELQVDGTIVYPNGVMADTKSIVARD